MDVPLPPAKTAREAVVDLAAIVGNLAISAEQIRVALVHTRRALAESDPMVRAEADRAAKIWIEESENIGNKAYDDVVALMSSLAGDG